ncbi:MAG: hypothetical protein HFJ30_04885, partial [Clostridia bacterium]|nr:hypothetical protein [Clostridia bacterium]MCI9412939.1 hypothetical protein [Clostridia bacterium]
MRKNQEMKKVRREVAHYAKTSVSSKISTSGITLVALVVTIVVLLILAGITLTYVFGDNGIIKLAKQAKNETEAGMQKEQDELGNLVNMLKDEYGNSTGGGNNGGSGNGDNTTNPPDQPEPPVEEPTIVGVIDKIQDTNTTVEDKNGNPITVPGGFKVVPNGGTGNVEYTYNGDGTPAVQDG